VGELPHRFGYNALDTQAKKAGCEVKSYYLPPEHTDAPNKGYELTATRPSQLTSEDVRKCVAIIGDGGAVNLRTMKRDLPLSQIVVIARWRGEIVGAGAIKPVRAEYAAGIAAKSGYAFPGETSELGYVAVDRAHRGRALSHEITRLLLSQYKGRLFATTDCPKMRKTLSAAGFRQRGKEWTGERGVLSLWERE
jgi:hypothetical protein